MTPRFEREVMISVTSRDESVSNLITFLCRRERKPDEAKANDQDSGENRSVWCARCFGTYRACEALPGRYPFKEVHQRWRHQPSLEFASEADCRA